MNKITKYLLILFFILLFIVFLLKGYEKEQIDIARKIGPKVGERELSMTDYYNLTQIIEDTYKDYLLKQDYKTAYSMLSKNFRLYLPFDEYEKEMSNKDNSKLKVADIKRVTKTTYHVKTNMSGEDFTIIIDKEDNKFTLLPKSFLDYVKPNIIVSKKNLKCTLIDYVVNINQTVFNFDLKNESKEEIKLERGILYTNLDDTVQSDLNIVILPKETKRVSITFDTNYAFPSKLILDRENNGKNNIEYSFKLDN